MRKKYIHFELKLLSLIILLILLKWYDGILFENYTIISILLVPILIIINITYIIFIIINFKHMTLNFKGMTIFLVLVYIFFLSFPLDIYKIKFNLHLHQQEYANLTEILKNESNIIENKPIILPDKFKKMSTNGEIYVLQKNPIIIKFYIFRGLFIGGSKSLIYIEDDNIKSLEKINNNNIKVLTKIQDYWYFIEEN